MTLASAVHAVTEFQHDEHLTATFEHGHEWVTCTRCGRQWSVNGSHAEIVSFGDNYCDDQPRE